jgi:hypothetical protein
VAVQARLRHHDPTRSLSHARSICPSLRDDAGGGTTERTGGSATTPEEGRANNALPFAKIDDGDVPSGSAGLRTIPERTGGSATTPEEG